MRSDGAKSRATREPCLPTHQCATNSLPALLTDRGEKGEERCFVVALQNMRPFWFTACSCSGATVELTTVFAVPDP